MFKKTPFIFLLLIVVTAGVYFYLSSRENSAPEIQFAQKATKLYWFIPDGMRAEEDLFTVYKWAKEGKRPNIKIMRDNGSYGYSIPDFPSIKVKQKVYA